MPALFVNVAAFLAAMAPPRALVARRAVVSALGGGILLVACAQPARPIGLTGPALLAKEAAQKQRECYDALECASDVPYYAIVCARDDGDCLERKRRLAREAISGSPTPSILASYLVGVALLRAAASALWRRDDT